MLAAAAAGAVRVASHGQPAPRGGGGEPAECYRYEQTRSTPPWAVASSYLRTLLLPPVEPQERIVSGLDTLENTGGAALESIEHVCYCGCRSAAGAQARRQAIHSTL